MFVGDSDADGLALDGVHGVDLCDGLAKVSFEGVVRRDDDGHAGGIGRVAGLVLEHRADADSMRTKNGGDRPHHAGAVLSGDAKIIAAANGVGGQLAGFVAAVGPNRKLL